MTAIYFQKMRKELILLYERFIKDPKNQILLNEIHKYDLEFGGLGSYNDYCKLPIMPDSIKKALGLLEDLYYEPLPYGTPGALSNEEIIAIAKEILQDLKKQDK